MLHLAGQGVLRRALLVRPEVARADELHQASVSLSLVLPSGSPMPELMVECPDGVTSHLAAWQQVLIGQGGSRRFERRLDFEVSPGFTRGAVRVRMEGHPDRVVQLAAGD